MEGSRHFLPLLFRNTQKASDLVGKCGSEEGGSGSVTVTKENVDDEEEEGAMVLDLGDWFRHSEAHSRLLPQKPQPLFSPRSFHPSHQPSSS